MSCRLYLQQPNDVVELRVLGAPSNNGFTRNYSGYFSELQALEKAVKKFDLQAPQYVSITVNPVNPALLARAANKMKPLKKGDHTTTDSDIVRRRWLPVDLDPVRPAGISSTEDEKQAAIDLAFHIMSDLAAEWGEPVHADSGNGMHLLYRLDLPNDAESDKLLKATLKALSAKYSNNKVKVDPELANASRILKAYGTTARKGDSTPDRPHRKSAIIYQPETFKPVSIKQLQAMAATLPEPPTSEHRKATNQSTVYDRARAYIEKCEPAIEGQNGDRVTFRTACVLINDFALDDSQALELLQGWNQTCQPPWTDRDLEDKIKHAKQYAKKPASELADKQLTTLTHNTQTARPAEPNSHNETSSRDLYNKIRNTDQGNAERLVKGANGTIKHSPARGWLVWTGNHWKADEITVRQLYLKHVVNTIYEELHTIDPTDKNEFKSLVSHARKSEQARSVSSCLQMAACMESVTFNHEMQDKDPFLFAADNKTIDLRTMEPKKHDPADMITRHSRVKYDKNADCPQWKQFLEDIFAGDNSLVEFVQIAIGYSLTGSTKEQCMFILYGTGRNGKSVFMNIMAHLLGTYAMETPPETLMRGYDKAERPSNDVARLAGARLVATNETEEGQFLAESKVKALTGDDKIIARFLHKEFFEFWPRFKIWIRTNHKPRIRGTDEGIWRRIKLIPFGVQIPKNKIDPNLCEKLKAELPGILNWALEGTELWQNCGLHTPPVVAVATEDYRASQDLLGSFLADRCLVCPLKQSGSVAMTELYDSYRDWCEEAGERPMSKRNLSFRLSERGFRRRKGAKGMRCWDGIRLEGDDSHQGGSIHDA